MTRIHIQQGDLTKMATDAIVNAANGSLLGGGGVDGAIHRAAGQELYYECLLLHGCKTGEAKITKGYNLPANHVIHTVGPVWNGGGNNEELLLANCYSNSLLLAMKNNLRSIAFPNISTGIFHFPKDKAALIALATVNTFIENHSDMLDDIYFVCFDEENYSLYQQLKRGTA